MDLVGGQLVANPIPEEAELAGAELHPHIDAALAQAGADGIVGKDVTPFLLGRVLESTAGRSLEANVALVRNNAALAAQIACKLTEVE